jgi:hypothetical protein
MTKGYNLFARLSIDGFVFLPQYNYRSVVHTVGPRYHEKYRMAAENALNSYETILLLHHEYLPVVTGTAFLLLVNKE